MFLGIKRKKTPRATCARPLPLHKRRLTVLRCGGKTDNNKRNVQHCCKTSRIWLLRVLPPTKKSLATLFVARQVRMRVLKLTTSVFISYCSNVAKQVARFCFPFHCSLALRELQRDACSFAPLSVRAASVCSPQENIFTVHTIKSKEPKSTLKKE